MNTLLYEQGYIHIPNFISKIEAYSLSTGFKKFTVEQGLLGDTQVPLSSAFYDYLPFVLLLVNKIPEVNNVYGHYLLPTYSYARVYHTGAELKEHIDRDACEVSLTVNLSKTENWPINFRTKDGNVVSIELDVGDAIMYMGCEIPHWRDVYKGEEHTQLFLHYVAAGENRSWAFFDKAQNKPSQKKLSNNFVGAIPVAIYE
jgi:hypothetical protein